MTLAKLILDLMAFLIANPTAANKVIRIEHRNCENDNPEGVGIYPYPDPDRIGLSFWRD